MDPCILVLTQLPVLLSRSLDKVVILLEDFAKSCITVEGEAHFVVEPCESTYQLSYLRQGHLCGGIFVEVLTLRTTIIPRRDIVEADSKLVAVDGLDVAPSGFLAGHV